MDRISNAGIGAASAQNVSHRIVDVFVGRVRILSEKGCRGHYLPRLAVAALGDVFLNPRLLKWMTPIGGESFDRCDGFSFTVLDWRRAGTGCLSVEKNGASSALSDAASVLCTCKPK